MLSDNALTLMERLDEDSPHLLCLDGLEALLGLDFERLFDAITELVLVGDRVAFELVDGMVCIASCTDFSRPCVSLEEYAAILEAYITEHQHRAAALKRAWVLPRAKN